MQQRSGQYRAVHTLWVSRRRAWARTRAERSLRTVKGMSSGWNGQQALPLTKITNPVDDKPMVHYPHRGARRRPHVGDAVVTGGRHSEDVLRLLGNGKQFGVHLNYTYQEGEGASRKPLGLVRTLPIVRAFGWFLATALSSALFLLRWKRSARRRRAHPARGAALSCRHAARRAPLPP